MLVSINQLLCHRQPGRAIPQLSAVSWILLQFVVSLPVMAQSGRSQYSLVRLQPASNASDVTAEDVNNSTNLVGAYQSSNGLVGYFYEHSAAAGQKYITLGSSFKPYGLNENNEIVGSNEQLQTGVYWSSPSSTPVLLPPLPGDAVSHCHDINNSGVVVGTSRLTWASAASVVAWQIGTGGQIHGPVLLPSLEGIKIVRGLSEKVEGISFVVGRLATDPTRGVVWTLGEDSSGNPSLLLTEELALAADVGGVNDFGDVTGDAATYPARPFLKYAENDPSQLTLLPLISKATSGRALDVNNSLQIVGANNYLSRGNGISRAVLWTTPETAVDLNSLVTLGKSESLLGAQKINDRGDILASLAKNGSWVGQCLLVRP